jgi:hypothetical protein
MRLDINGSQELQDIARAIAASDAEVRKAIRVFTKAELTRPWLEAINSEASTTLERRVISSTATIAVSDVNIRIQSAAKGRRLKGGLNPKEDYAPVEFGAHPKMTTYTRKGHKVTRNTHAQFKPQNRKGYVFYPAARKMIPRLASLWVQTVVKTYALIFDGKG